MVVGRTTRLRLVPLAALCLFVGALVTQRLITRRSTAGARHSVPSSSRETVSSLRGQGVIARQLSTPGQVNPKAFSVYRGDSRRTHRSPIVGPTVARIAWKVSVDGPVQSQVLASADGRELYVSSLGGSIRALSAADGSVLWSVPLSDRSYSTPFIAAGALYVGSDAKALVRLGADGKVTYRLDLGGEIDGAPAQLDDGTIVVAADRNIVGVRPRGDVAFRLPSRGKVFTSPAVSADGTLYWGAQDHALHAAREGRESWKIDLGSDVDGGPSIMDDGTIVCGTDGGEVVRVSREGTIIWRTAVGGFVRGGLTIARDSAVLAGVYGPTPGVVRLDGATGKVLGRFPVQGTGATQFGVHGGPLEDAAGTLYFGTQEDAVYAVSASGEDLFRLPVDGDVDAPLTLLPHGVLLVATDSGTIYAVGP